MLAVWPFDTVLIEEALALGRQSFVPEGRARALARARTRPDTGPYCCGTFLEVHAVLSCGSGGSTARPSLVSLLLAVTLLVLLVLIVVGWFGIHLSTAVLL